MEWFETKVKFLRQMDNGRIKKITEQYLVDSMSFTEAEGRVMTEATEGMREVTVVSIKRSSIKETVMYGDTDLFFKVKVSYELMDEETEKSKKANIYLLVNANDAKEAYERTEEHLKEMLVPFTITQISESPIIEVYQYQKGVRPGLRRVTKEDSATPNDEREPIGFKNSGNSVVNAGFSKESQSAKVPAPDPTNGQAVHFDADIEEGYTDLEERLENAMQPRPDYPVWLLDQLAGIFGGDKTVGQLVEIIEKHDSLPRDKYANWLMNNHNATLKQSNDSLTALKQPRE